MAEDKNRRVALPETASLGSPFRWDAYLPRGHQIGSEFMHLYGAPAGDIGGPLNRPHGRWALRTRRTPQQAGLARATRQQMEAQLAPPPDVTLNNSRSQLGLEPTRLWRKLRASVNIRGRKGIWPRTGLRQPCYNQAPPC